MLPARGSVLICSQLTKPIRSELSPSPVSSTASASRSLVLSIWALALLEFAASPSIECRSSVSWLVVTKTESQSCTAFPSHGRLPERSARPRP